MTFFFQARLVAIIAVSAIFLTSCGTSGPQTFYNGLYLAGDSQKTNELADSRAFTPYMAKIQNGSITDEDMKTLEAKLQSANTAFDGVIKDLNAIKEDGVGAAELKKQSILVATETKEMTQATIDFIKFARDIIGKNPTSDDNKKITDAQNALMKKAKTMQDNAQKTKTMLGDFVKNNNIDTKAVPVKK